MLSAGKAAFEKFNELCIEGIDVPWDQVPPEQQKHWEAIADAAINRYMTFRDSEIGSQSRPDWWTPEHEQAALDGVRDQQRSKYPCSCVSGKGPCLSCQ